MPREVWSRTKAASVWSRALRTNVHSSCATSADRRSKSLLGPDAKVVRCHGSPFRSAARSGSGKTYTAEASLSVSSFANASGLLSNIPPSMRSVSVSRVQSIPGSYAVSFNPHVGASQAIRCGANAIGKAPEARVMEPSSDIWKGRPRVGAPPRGWDLWRTNGSTASGTNSKANGSLMRAPTTSRSGSTRVVCAPTRMVWGYGEVISDP